VLRVRDGEPDVAACGAALDLALVDRFDTVRDCELVDRARSDRPARGKAAVVRPTGGEAAFRLPGANRFVPLQESLRVPIGSSVDARAGAVRLRTASARTRAGQVAARAEPVRRLWGRIGKRRGKFRTRGKYSSGVVRGTVWLTEDRCDGTLTRVASGTVRVHDFARRRVIVVRAGERYLARAPADPSR